ncbi:hypothetical protein K438DRAFT_2031477 [Mycena galopus ATCC 62051]|nr:hypothetical protein K438DRAFT_2031477 [Mycena galopus ATCC 62051]
MHTQGPRGSRPALARAPSSSPFSRSPLQQPLYFALLLWLIFIFSLFRLFSRHLFSALGDYETREGRAGEQGYEDVYFPVVVIWGFALVVVVGLEKRRNDRERVIHHVVMVWMVTWSYMMNITLQGNAVFVSMDVSDVLLASSPPLFHSSGDDANGVRSRTGPKSP